MGEKVIINGKEYTERNISFIEINGKKITNGIITPQIGENGPKVSAIIQVDGSSFETSSSEFIVQGDVDEAVNNIKEQSTNSNSINNEIENRQVKVKNSWISKLVEKIKNIFSNIRK